MMVTTPSGADVDEGLWRQVGRHLRLLRCGERCAIKIQSKAAARKGRQLQKRSPVDAHKSAPLYWLGAAAPACAAS